MALTYDVFGYFDHFEDELCEIRFELLDPHVDFFVVWEANETFSGVSKTFNFDIERYAKWKHKIIYHKVEDVPKDFYDPNCDQQILGWARSSPNVTRESFVWLKEFYIKEHVRRTLEKLLKPQDVCYISDLDEVWNWELKPDFTQDVIYKPKQLPYTYYLNMRTDEDWLGWSGTICANWKTIELGIINHLRTDELTSFIVLENGGWHFGTLGGKEKKMEASKHSFYTDQIWHAREKNMRIDESDLPKTLNKTKWNHLFA